jgi:hypothetical protein
LRVYLLVLSVLFHMAMDAQTRPQADCGCGAALAKDISSSVHGESQKMRFLQVIDEDTFSEAKHNSSFSLGLPIADDLVKASADWGDFQTQRAKLFRHSGYQIDTNLTDLKHFEVTSPLAYQYWGECMRLCAQGGTGLFAWKEREDRNAIVVHIYYKVPASDRNQSVSLSGTLKRGASPEEEIFDPDTQINSEQTISKIISRSANGQNGIQPLLLTVDAGQFASTLDSVWADPLPPPPLPPPPPPTCDARRQLQRYAGTYNHLATTAPMNDPNFHFERTLGWVCDHQQQGTVPVYSCINNSPKYGVAGKMFTSLDQGCGGLGVKESLEGYIFSFSPGNPPTDELFLCSANGDFFVSLQSNCEGHTVLSPLGFIPKEPN